MRSAPFLLVRRMARDNAEAVGTRPGGGPGSEASDHSLLRRFRGGNTHAATQLYLRYAHRLRALVKARCSAELARRIEPDDIVQSVFHRFFRGVRRGHYDVPPGDELWRLFLVIALNKIRAEENFHRAGKRDVRITVAEQSIDSRAESDRGAQAVLELTIKDFLEQLPQTHRTVVEQRVQGHDVATIASQTGRSKRTVERILQEIRRKLGSVLEAGEDHAQTS
jgi:RNA polymerase sigma factor (sigma-70 family)